MKDKIENIHAGHRKSVRERYIRRGSLDEYADHQILEMLLFYAIQRRDVNPLAHKLIDRFGSLKSVITADFNDLCRAGLSENTATLLRLVGDIGKAIDRSETYKSVIKTTADAVSACYGLLFREKAETVLVLCLNSKNQVIRICKRSDGVSNSVSALPKWIVETAISVQANAIILAHNHPSGSVEPSSKDIETTNALEQLLKPLDIVLYDHIIVTHDECYSLARSYKQTMPAGESNEKADDAPGETA